MVYERLLARGKSKELYAGDSAYFEFTPGDAYIFSIRCGHSNLIEQIVEFGGFAVAVRYSSNEK